VAMEVITKYDGTRFITEEEIDREFTGHWVLIRLEDENSWDDGYLIASAEGRDELRWELEKFGMAEHGFSDNAKIKYGCKTRGDCLHVELLD